MRVLACLGAALLGLCVSATTSLAAGPVFDDGFLVLKLVNEVRSNSDTKPATVTYSPSIRLRAFGVAKGDAIKVKWRKGKKVLYSKRCALNVRDGEGKLGLGDRCWTRDAGLTAHGAIEADIIFVDDSEEKESPLRTLKVEVGRFWQVDRIMKGKAIQSPRYQVVGRDLMGLSYAWLRDPGSNPRGDVYFYFWAALDKDARNFKDPSWRCKLNGKKVPALDINGHSIAESITDIKADDEKVIGKERKLSRYRWDLIWIKPKLVWGKTKNPKSSANVSTSRYNISTNPGKYACRLRSEGETVREFTFTVKPDGTLTKHGAQGPGGISLRPGAFFIDMKIVANKNEKGFDAKAAKASVAFGRPWLKTADVKALHAAFPKSFGTVAPKPPKGSK